MAALLIALLIPNLFAQLPESSPDRYIEQTFQQHTGTLPKMGWFAGTRGFLATDDTAGQLTLLGAVGFPLTARKKGIIPGGSARADIRRIYGVACEIDSADHLITYDAGREMDSVRTFYIPKPIDDIRRGLITAPLDPAQIANINRLLAWTDEHTLRRDEAIAVRAQSPFYSLHKLYNAKTGLLSEEAIVLHKKDGSIIGHELKRQLEGAPLCDGCDIPSYWNAAGLYHPQNMFEIPGFAYPVLLLDSSTIEGQALTLLTFTADGNLATYRIYEYVMNCR